MARSIRGGSSCMMLAPLMCIALAVLSSKLLPQLAAKPLTAPPPTGSPSRSPFPPKKSPSPIPRQKPPTAQPNVQPPALAPAPAPDAGEPVPISWYQV